MTFHGTQLKVGLTRQLAERAHGISADAIPDDVREIVRHSVTDLVGLALSSAHLPLIRVLREEAQDREGRASASAVGARERVPDSWAATINAAAGHVLAYDDATMVIPGHTTAISWPVAMALSESLGADGRAVLEAFVAGSETMSIIGEMLAPSHYEAGFHASGTIGAFGAAAVAAKLMKLDVETTAQALSLAASMASGLKGGFGTMVKPLQVARAAGNGILAASLARRGLGGRGDLLEAAQGFAATHSRETLPARIPAHPVGHYIRRTIYKYHAACYLTHGPIEAAAGLRRSGKVDPGSIEEVKVTVNPMASKVCNIQQPTSGPELGYSLRTLVAMAFSGISVTRPEDLSMAHLDDPQVKSLLNKVSVAFDGSLADTQCRLEIRTSSGNIEETLDLGAPETNMARQCQRIGTKFRALASASLGDDRVDDVIDLVSRFDSMPDLEPIASLFRAA